MVTKGVSYPTGLQRKLIDYDGDLFELIWVRQVDAEAVNRGTRLVVNVVSKATDLKIYTAYHDDSPRISRSSYFIFIGFAGNCNMIQYAYTL